MKEINNSLPKIYDLLLNELKVMKEVKEVNFNI